MAWWKRKNDGFVWREYVRTTVLVRRDQRRKQIEDIKVAAIEGAKEAGRKSVELGAEGAKRAATGTSRALYLGLMGAVDVLIAVAAATWLWIVHSFAPAVGALFSAAISALGTASRPLLRAVRTASAWPLATPALALTCAIASLSAVAGSSLGWPTAANGFATVMATAAAALLIAAHGPLIANMTGLDRIRVPELPTGTKAAAGGVMLAMVAATAWMLGWLPNGINAVTSGAGAVLHSGAGLISGATTIEGRAIVSSPTRLKVAGTNLQLYGIEAPEQAQACGSRGCSAAAKSALQQIVQGKRVTCTLSGRTENGSASATCTAGGVDVAAQLVRGGNVFATAGLFAPYASQEREAKNERRGMWKANVDRPEDYRSKAFEEAKKGAPDGCPIKGLVNGDSKTYLPPWSPDYAKAKVRSSRGERWFCSEDEARAAGWRPEGA